MAVPPGPVKCCTEVPTPVCRQYDAASARASVTPKLGVIAAPAYVPLSAWKASSSVEAALKFSELIAAVASRSAFLADDDVGPFDCMLVAHKMATSPSETTIEIRPKARPITRAIGL